MFLFTWEVVYETRSLTIDILIMKSRRTMILLYAIRVVSSHEQFFFSLCFSYSLLHGCKHPPADVVIVGTAIPNTLISINTTAQLPLKLTPNNYSSWGVQFPTAKLWSHGEYWGNISMSTKYHLRQRHLSAKSSLLSLDTTRQFLTTCNFCITFWCCYTSHLCSCHNFSLGMDQVGKPVCQLI